jgi:hypothetical protein
MLRGRTSCCIDNDAVILQKILAPSSSSLLCRDQARYNVIYELVPKKLLKQDAEELGCSYKKFVALGGGQENDCEVLITMFLLVPTLRLENIRLRY